MMRNQKGFAIPMSIIVIGFLTVGLMAAYARVDNDYRIAKNRTDQVDAYTLAQTGLERYMVDRANLGFTSFPPAASESTRIILTGGYADVVSKQVRDTVGNLTPIYVVRSRGTTTPSALSGMKPATHTVAQYASWKTGSIDVNAGWTSLGGLNKAGASGALSGADNCGQKATLAGVQVPAGGFTGQTEPVSGNPPIDATMSEAALNASVNIDWANIRTGATITPDIRIPGQSFPAVSDFTADYWPVILVTGDFSLPNDGHGTLIVTGNLFLGGNADWEGVIMVGNALTDNGSGSSIGATFSGLDELLGESVDASRSEAKGTKQYRYDSCNVSKALAKFGSLVGMKNTWIDNWAW